MKGKENSKRSNNFLLAVALVLFLFSLALLFYNFGNKPYESRVFRVHFVVGDRVGFDLNKSALTFGIIPPGGTGTRNIIIENDQDFPLKCKVYISDNLVDLVYSENNFVIPPRTNRELGINIYVPQNVSYGNYTGEIKIELRK